VVRETLVLGIVNEVNASRAVALTAPNAVRETLVLGTVNEVNASRAVALTAPSVTLPLFCCSNVLLYQNRREVYAHKTRQIFPSKKM